MKQRTRFLRFSAGRLVFAILCSTPAWATTNFIVNGSFETIPSGVTSSFDLGLDHNISNWNANFPSPNNQFLDCLVVLSAGNNTVCGTTNFGGPPGGGNQTFVIWPGASPDGGNFVAMDSDSRYQSVLTQTVTGLTPGHGYAILFYQGAVQ